MKTRAQRHQIRKYQWNLTQLHAWTCKAVDAMVEATGATPDPSLAREEIFAMADAYQNLRALDRLSSLSASMLDCMRTARERETELSELLKAERKKTEALDTEAQALIESLRELEDLT